jgi:hypothetical protein
VSDDLGESPHRTRMSDSLSALEGRVGNPAAKWDVLNRRVQDDATRLFGEVEDVWLDLMWTLDAYRVARVLPAGFKDFGAFNRGKGQLVCRAVVPATSKPHASSDRCASEGERILAAPPNRRRMASARR